MSNVEDRRDFGTFIPSFLDDFGLDMPCFRLYAHIARRAGSGLCWESINAMAKVCQMNRKTAYKAFAVLQEHKLILVEKRIGQTSLITLTSNSVWIPIPNQGQVEGVPKKGQVKKSPIPDQGQPPIPDQGQPPIPDQGHKGTPSEGTPIKAKENTGFEENPKKTVPEKTVDESAVKDPLENQETPPPPTPAAPLPHENLGKAIAISKQAERYQQFEARFTQAKPINRHVPKAFVDAGYGEWHNGASPLDWRKSLIDVCIQRKKKRGDESTVGAATDFIVNVISECIRLGMWTKFQNLVDAALKLEESLEQQAQRSQQQQPTPSPVPIEREPVPQFVIDRLRRKKCTA